MLRYYILLLIFVEIANFSVFTLEEKKMANTTNTSIVAESAAVTAVLVCVLRSRTSFRVKDTVEAYLSDRPNWPTFHSKQDCVPPPQDPSVPASVPIVRSSN
jgi:hypothetical protein